MNNMKVKLLYREKTIDGTPETNESFERRINEIISTHKHNPPIFLSVDLCYIYYEEDNHV